MKLLGPTPAGFAPVDRAFAQAHAVPTAHRVRLRVGLVWQDELVAVDQLDSYRQAAFLAQRLSELGYAELLLGTPPQMHGCDVVFQGPVARDDGDEPDPSFIRRAPVQLWA
jgi:hypothetical protein